MRIEAGFQQLFDNFVFYFRQAIDIFYGLMSDYARKRSDGQMFMISFLRNQFGRV